MSAGRQAPDDALSGATMRDSLRLRLTLTYLGLAIVPLVAVAALVGQRSVSELRGQSEALQHAVATRVAQGIGSFIDGRFDELRAFALGSALARLGPDAQHAALAKLLAHDGLYEEISLLAADGRARLRLSRSEVVLPGEGARASAREAFAAAVTQRDAYIGQVRFDERLREPLATIALPLVDRRSGVLASVLIAELRLAQVWNLLGSLTVPSAVEVYVLDAGGRVVAHRNPATVLAGTRLPNMAAGGTLRIDGREHLAVSAPIGLGGETLTVLATRPIATAFRPVTQILWIAAALTLAAVLVAGTLVVFSVRNVVRPIERLAATARRVSGGELGVEPEVGGRGEVRALGVAFARMLRDLRRSMAETREAHQRMARQEKLAAVGQMAGELGHELRNPLGTIENAAAVLDAAVPESDAQSRRAVRRIRDQVQRTTKLTNELLSFARTREATRSATAMEAVIAEALAKCPPPANVVLNKQIPADAPPVLVDPDQIEQVLVNLVRNAYEAMPDGGALTIRVEADADHTSCLVADTGVGIPSDAIERVFEPLFTTKPEGVGLGLAICRNLAEANAGSLAAESREGIGTTFRLELPRR